MSDPTSNPVDEALNLVDDECQVASDYVHVLSDASDDDEVKIVEEDFRSLVDEEDCQVKEVHEEAKQNITSDSSGRVVLRRLKLVDEKCKIVIDQPHVLSEPSESSLLPVVELMCLDGEVKYLHPGVEEVQNVGKPLATLEPDEVELAPKSVSGAAEAANLEYYTFSPTTPRFSVILANSHVRKYYLIIPPKIVGELHQDKVPVVLNSYGKIWAMFYNGHLKTKSFETSGWRQFVADNKLKVGDACFFELIENSPKRIVFKVVIVRTDSSPSCVEAVDDGTSSDKPILID